MGREQPSSGQAGEDAAGFYLRHFFTNRSRCQSGSAIDLICSGLRAAKSSQNHYHSPTVEFHFQAKNSLAPFQVQRSTFNEWLSLTETQPVILLALQEVSGKRQEWWYCNFHDWLLTERGQEALSNQGVVYFNVDRDFTHVEESDENFHATLLAEEDRAVASPLSTWSTLRDYGSLPFDEGLFLQHLELVSHAEVPVAIFHGLRLEPSVPRAIRRAIEGASDGKTELIEWMRDIRKRAGDSVQTAFQRRQFAQFIWAMEQWHACKEIPVMPAFHTAEVNTWRAFSAMYPQSLGMYEGVIRYSWRSCDVMFTATMLPVLANATDRRVSAAAWDVIQLLDARRTDFPDYGFRRELFRSPAEAGDSKSLTLATDFITRPELRLIELAFLSKYGWTEDALESHITRKLQRPTVRDENLRRFYDGMANSLLVR